MRNRSTLLWWSVFSLTVISLVVIAYFLHGGTHGLYADDYPYKYWAYSLSSASWIPTWNFSPARPLNYLVAPNLANALPNYELQARVGVVALQLLNVVLLGALAFRLAASRRIALLSGAFFFAPVFAESAVLWFTGAVIYLPSLMLMLVGMHLVLSCRSATKQFALLVGAIAAWCAMVLFIESGFFVLLLVPALIWVRRVRGSVGLGSTLESLAPSFIAVGITYLLVIPYAFFALRTSSEVAVHGATTFDPLYIVGQRIPQTLDSLVAHVRDWEPGGLLAEALNLGLRQWLSTSAGWGLLGLALIGLTMTVILSPLHGSPATVGSASPSARLFLVGVAWVGLAVAPVLFIVDLPLNSSVLLFPSAGFALALAGLFGWLLEHVHHVGPMRPFAARGLLILAGASVLVSSLAMAGLLGVYQMRWERDRQEVMALRSAVPHLPDSPVWVAPISLDERTVNLYLGRRSILDPYLYGLFQVPWAATPALKMEYRDDRIGVINQDAHGGVHLVGLRYAEGGGVETLSFQGISQAQEVSPAELIAFTYRGDRLVLFDHLRVTMPDGSKSEVDLPLAGQVAKAGVPTRTLNLKLEGDSP